MSGRGRGRPPSRSAQEPAAGTSRRSTRQQQQQQHQNAAQSEEAQPPSLSAEEEHQEQQQPQELREQAHDQNPQLHAPVFHQNIDPAITGSQDGGMPPPPVPSAKGSRGHTGQQPSRRGTRNSQDGSVVSVNSISGTDAFSSQPEPQNPALQRPILGRAVETPERSLSIVSSALDDTPSRRATRAKLMTVMLSRLFTAADDYFNHIASDQTDPEMWEIERQGFKGAFDTYRLHYVADAGEPFVDPDFVANVMRLERTSPLWYKVFRVVSAANLATLLDDITPVKPEHLLPQLQAWYSAFPNFFVGEGSDNTAQAMSAKIIDTALMIRTHLSISTLENLNNLGERFHPLEQVVKIWCDGVVSVESIEAFLDNNHDAIQLKPIAPADSENAELARERNAKRFGSICGQLPKEAVASGSLDLAELHDAYRLPESLDHLRDFVKDCFANIKALLQQDLAHSDVGSRADSQIRFQLEADTMGQAFDRSESGTQATAYDLTTLRMMKDFAQEGAAYGDSHQLSQSSYPPAPRIPYPPGFSSPSPGLGYADPSQQAGLQPNGSMYAGSAAQVSGRKRGPQGDSSVADGSTAPPAKKTRARRKRRDVPEATMGPPSTTVPGSAPLAPPAGQSQYPPLPGTQDEPDFDALSQRTREISAAARKVKEPQVRSSWVSRDVKLLVKAVNTYQCKWSTIEKEIKAGTIPFERPRDQQALRDKARLLKQDFLKADMVLPRGFDLVVLGKKEREAVKAVGRNPDRREADIDENGQPINTQYAEDGAAPAALPAALPAPLPPVDPQTEQQLQQLQHQPEHQPEPQAEHQSAVPGQAVA